ncbi:MAG: family finger-like protein [Proteobacteria bacterium]|nr:family finger-like protein [Pseudomonadota bacterium]
MKTRCPDCQTTFRVTPEQLKARAGKVRCGQCQGVFNALDSLLDETLSTPPLVPRASASQPPSPAAPEPVEPSTDLPRASSFVADDSPGIEPTFSEPTFAEPAFSEPIFAEAVAATQTATEPTFSEPTFAGPAVADEFGAEPAIVEPTLTESAAQELGKATGLIMPRETTEIPGYSKWSEGVMAAPVSSAPEKAARWPFTVAALLLVMALAAQLVFRFRSEIAITLPSLRPVLELLCRTLDAEIPLPRHVELVSIETSDLQTDPARGNLLVLNATLRNRANYGQAFPSLELSLTDTQDAAIARRVFAPAEYLPAKIRAGQPFAANSDVAVRLWIEAKEIAAAGYRLYVFYP